MIIHGIHYHTDHLFPVAGKQVEAAIQEAFATGLLESNKCIRLEPKAMVARGDNEL